MSSSSNVAPNADQRQIDKQMAGVIEAIMTQSYSLANKGLIPSDQQVASYIESLEEVVIVQKIRRHPGAAATRALQAEDSELLRWARLVGGAKAR